MSDVEIGGGAAPTDSDQDQDLDINDLDEAIGALADDDVKAQSDEQPGPDQGDEDTDGDDLDVYSETEDGSDFEEGDDAVVKLSDGEEVSIGELKKGYHRNKDYTHKTEALSQEKQEVETLRSNVDQSRQFLQNAYQNLTDFLTGIIPPEPDISLSQSDPGQYQYQLALRNNAIKELNNALGAKAEVDKDGDQLKQGDWDRYKSAQDRELTQVMPGLKDPKRRAAFDAKNKETALEFGFAEKEISSTFDNRILRLVHYARIGKIAEKNRQNAGRRVSEKATKGTSRTVPAVGGKSGGEAMKRLSETGSIEDAARALLG